MRQLVLVKFICLEISWYDRFVYSLSRDGNDYLFSLKSRSRLYSFKFNDFYEMTGLNDGGCNVPVLKYGYPVRIEDWFRHRYVHFYGFERLLKNTFVEFLCGDNFLIT